MLPKRGAFVEAHHFLCERAVRAMLKINLKRLAKALDAVRLTPKVDPLGATRLEACTGRGITDMK